MTEIIALSGYARSGKDEAAKVLVDEFGFTQVAFADKLRDVLYALNPIVNPTPEKYFAQDKSPLRVKDVIDTYGWQGYKETQYGVEVRHLLQRLGTEAGRQTLWDTIWIDAALTDFGPDDKVVVSDARFFNEFDAVKDRGGTVWRIDRPGVGPVSDHPSETEAPNYKRFDAYVTNEGSLANYRNTIRALYKRRDLSKYDDDCIV